MTTKMTTDEREAFLADLHVGIIGIARQEGAPLTVPVWYDYEPGGKAWVVTGVNSLKGRLLKQVDRISLCAQSEAMPYKYVSVEGTFSVRDSTEEELLAMAIRYLGEEGGKAYVESTGHENNITVLIDPDIWFTVDYAKTMG